MVQSKASCDIKDDCILGFEEFPGKIMHLKGERNSHIVNFKCGGILL